MCYLLIVQENKKKQKKKEEKSTCHACVWMLGGQRIDCFRDK